MEKLANTREEYTLDNGVKCIVWGNRLSAQSIIIYPKGHPGCDINATLLAIKDHIRKAQAPDSNDKLLQI